MHALTGSDTTSRISTKSKAFKIAQSDTFRDNLAMFGEDELTGDLLRVAECFLVRCFATVDAAALTTFDELRYFIYHKSKKIELDSFPSSSSCMKIFPIHATVRNVLVQPSVPVE